MSICNPVLEPSDERFRKSFLSCVLTLGAFKRSVKISSYLQYGRVVRKGVLSSSTTRSSRSIGKIAYHYSYLQSSRAVRKGVLSSGTTRTNRATGETVSHYRHLE